MRTPPPGLPPIPEGWTYIGNETEINIDGCENERARGLHITRERGGWGEDIHTSLRMWWDGVSLPGKGWHYIAVTGSRLALLNGGTCLCGGKMVDEDDGEMIAVGMVVRPLRVTTDEAVANTSGYEAEVKPILVPRYLLDLVKHERDTLRAELNTKIDELHAIIGRLRGDVKDRDRKIDEMTDGRDKLLDDRGVEIDRLRRDANDRAAELGKLKDELDHRAAALDRWQAAYHDAATRADKLEREKRALREVMIRHRDLLVEYAGD